jgi:hypothetical protein
MNRQAYFLALLLIWAQVDDAWAAAPASPSESLADDDDEYLPARRRPQEEEGSLQQKPVFVGLKPQNADLPPVQRDVPSEWNLTTSFAPPPLYFFMSLQI